jgi:hypothetical protein
MIKVVKKVNSNKYFDTEGVVKLHVRFPLLFG